jgi:hypothetical protein
MEIKWRKELAETSANYPVKGSFYSQYVYVQLENNMQVSLQCQYRFKEKKFVLQVEKRMYKNLEKISYEVLKEYPHESKYMKQAKAYCEQIINTEYSK